MSVLHFLCLAVHWLAYSVLAMTVEVLSEVVTSGPTTSVLGILTAALVLLDGRNHTPEPTTSNGDNK